MEEGLWPGVRPHPRSVCQAHDGSHTAALASPAGRRARRWTCVPRSARPTKKLALRRAFLISDRFGFRLHHRRTGDVSEVTFSSYLRVVICTRGRFRQPQRVSRSAKEVPPVKCQPSPQDIAGRFQR